MITQIFFFLTVDGEQGDYYYYYYFTFLHKMAIRTKDFRFIKRDSQSIEVPLEDKSIGLM
jgi:hypothetical protein